MTNINNDLAQRAVACRHWRWLPGMRSVSIGGHSRRLDPPRQTRGLHPWWTWSAGQDDEGLPDLDDPATLGCLLALVREALGDPAAHCEQLFTGDWAVFDKTGGWRRPGATEAEALVAALEVTND